MDIKIVPVDTVEGDNYLSFTSKPKFKLDYSRPETLMSEGTHVLAQMVVKLLFTRRGSVLSSPKEGTLLPALAGTSNNIPTEIASTIVEDAISSVESYVRLIQGPGTTFSPSEILDSITLQGLIVTDSSIQASLSIVNSLGESCFIRVGI